MIRADIIEFRPEGYDPDPVYCQAAIKSVPSKTDEVTGAAKQANIGEIQRALENTFFPFFN